MSNETFLVRPHNGKWSEVVTAEISQAGPAIEYAKERAIQTGEPHAVYSATLIGTSTLPRSEFIDQRPKAIES
jgi:hypothetical protein